VANEKGGRRTKASARKLNTPKMREPNATLLRGKIESFFFGESASRGIFRPSPRRLQCVCVSVVRGKRERGRSRGTLGHISSKVDSEDVFRSAGVGK